MIGPSPLSPEVLAGIDSLKQFADANPAIMAELKARLGFVPPPPAEPTLAALPPATQVFPVQPVAQWSFVPAPIEAPQPPQSATPDAGVARSDSVVGLVQQAEVNPQLMAILQQTFGSQIAAAQKNPLASLGGGLAAAAFAHFGLSVDPQVTTLIGIGSAILVGDLYQYAVGKWFPPKPVSPLQAAVAATTKGTTS